MSTLKKRPSLHNKLESLDQFKVEHNFQYTSKQTKGSIIGFCLSTLYFIILATYAFDRLKLFWTHEEDSFGSFQEEVNPKENEEFFFKDF